MEVRGNRLTERNCHKHVNARFWSDEVTCCCNGTENVLRLGGKDGAQRNPMHRKYEANSCLSVSNADTSAT